LIDSKELSFLTTCIYCGTKLEKRDSEFVEIHRHYKTIKCIKCGKVHRHRVNFLGSGHDKWNEELLKMAKRYLN
jgi:NAD-dependent SIR2 family protein deacetylase